MQMQPPLSDSLAKQWLGTETDRYQQALLLSLGIALLWLCAKIEIPFYPVPLTLQTFAVLMIGMSYGWRLGASTVMGYLALGAAGLPVFAGTPEKGIGLAYMVGPTGGYLLGFAVAAAVCGYLAQTLNWGRTMLTTLAAMVIGNAIIYLFGLAWLGAVVGWDQPVLAWGLTPFLLGDALKIALAAATLPLIWRAAKK